MTILREYEQTHPWIRFRHDLAQAPFSVWLLLGEARAKCQYIMTASVHPVVGEDLRRVYLAKGALATTAIEGNPLTEEQARGIVDKQLELPPSQQYLGQQIENVLEAYNLIANGILAGDNSKFAPELIAEYNALILKDLPLNPEVVPGKLRHHEVNVGRYRGAPPADCAYLVDRLCDWMNQPVPEASKRYATEIEILKAIIAHLYMAWIHPFSDGNGRTARLIEFKILLGAGLPDIAVHLLSNHYNKTRDEYYRQLDYSSRSGGEIFPFVEYALQGFVDGLDDQIQRIQNHQLVVQWRDYVHRAFDDDSLTALRQKQIVQDLTRNSLYRQVSVSDIPDLSARVARMYGDKTKKTIQRDITAMEQMGLIVNQQGIIRANIEIIRSFLPRKVQSK